MLSLATKEIARVRKQLAKTEVYIPDKISQFLARSCLLQIVIFLFIHDSRYQEFSDCGLGCVQASKFFSESLFTILLTSRCLVKPKASYVVSRGGGVGTAIYGLYRYVSL